MNPLTASEIAALVQGELMGNPDVTVEGVASLERAAENEVAFLGSEKYAKWMSSTHAPVVLVPRTYDAPVPEGRAWIKCENPTTAFSELVSYFLPPFPKPQPGVHPSAVVSKTAQVAGSASIGPNVVIEDRAVIGANTVIRGGAYVGMAASIGEDCLIYPNVTILERIKIGNRVTIHSGTVIGSDGFGFEMSADGHKKVPQVGYVQIDDDVEIGSNCSVDRARFEKTWIKRGAKIDNLIQIAHNVIIGEHVILVAQVGIAGSAVLGKGVIVAGQVGVAGHVEIGEGAVLRPKSGIWKDVAPRQDIMGIPAEPFNEWKRTQASLRRLPQLRKMVLELRKEVEDLKQNR